MKIAASVDNKMELSLDYMSLGDDYITLNKFDSALLLEERARDYAVQSNYTIYLGFILQSIGNIHFLKKNYDSAGRYYKEAMNASIAEVNLKDEINSFLSMAKLARTTGQTDSSLFYSMKALQTSQSFGVPSGIMRSYNSIFLAYKLLGNSDSAFAYLQLAKSLGDSLNNIDRAKINQYQSLNLNNQIELQEAEKAKIRYQNKIRMYGFIAGIVALLLIAFLLLRNLRHRKKANELLQSQKEQIEKQKTNIEQTLSDLKAKKSKLDKSEKMASL